MLLRRIESEGLAHYSYLLAEGGEAVVVDARRDIDAYLALLRERGLRLRAILETHRNEDYATGSTALAAATGAPTLHSRRMRFGYGESVADGDKLGIGKLELRVLETPGHTDESLTFAVADLRSGSGAVLAFTGDALFPGEVGRTDLYGKEQALRMAEALYDSLTKKILPLGDGVSLFASHGGGSVCGGSILDRDVSTLGYERLFNPRLAGERSGFVAHKQREQLVVPPYFKRMEEWNQRGTAPIHARLPVPPPLTLDEFGAELDKGALVLDCRTPQAFAAGHVPRSLNIWFAGLTAFLGWVAKYEDRLLFILPQGTSAESLGRTLLRLGYEGSAAGVLRGGFDTWQDAGRPLARLATIDTEELRGRRDVLVLDVREPFEVAGGTVEGALPVFAGEVPRKLAAIPRDTAVAAMCSVGHRGSVAASLLARSGYGKVMNYLGGFTAWKAAKLPVGKPRPAP